MAIEPADYFRPDLLELAAYPVQDATGLIKLDAMENPYAWPDELVGGWLQSLRSARPNRYPDPEARKLKAALRSAFGIPDASGLLLGNGSDELIQILLLPLVGTDAVVMAPEPTFVMYRQVARWLNLRYVGVPLRSDDFGLDLPELREAITRECPRILFLAYPNNPTGNLYDRVAMAELIESAPGLVVVDEAYGPFAGDSFLDDLSRHPNLLVMRTLSKMGFAGLRLGFLCGAPEWLRQFDKLRLPYNINVLTQLTVIHALSRRDLLDTQIDAILAERARLARHLAALPGVVVYASQANFLLLRLMERKADAVYAQLQEQGVLVKNLSAQGGALAGCLRVTVGTPEENDRFLSSFCSCL